MAESLITAVIGVDSDIRISFTRYDDGKARMMAGEFTEGGKVVDIVFDFAELIDTVRILLGHVQRGQFDADSPLSITPEQRAELVLSLRRIMASDQPDAEKFKGVNLELARVARPDANLSVVLAIAEAVHSLLDEAAEGLADAAVQ